MCSVAVTKASTLLADSQPGWRRPALVMWGTAPSGADNMETRRKPLAKLGGRRRMPASGLTIASRRTRGLDDWVAYIAKTKSAKLILADRALSVR